MGYDYDPDEAASGSPELGVQVRILIGQCEDAISKTSGKPMMILNCAVAEDQQGAGFDTKFYMVNFNTGWVMSAVGIDPDIPIHIDDLTFRGMDAAVIFKLDKWTTKSGDVRETIKIDKWVPRDKATITLSADPGQAAMEQEIGSEKQQSATDAEQSTENAMEVQKPDEPKYKDKLPF